MVNADFSGAKLTSAIFDDAYANGANFVGAQLDNASFRNAELELANFQKCISKKMLRLKARIWCMQNYQKDKFWRVNFVITQ